MEAWHLLFMCFFFLLRCCLAASADTLAECFHDLGWYMGVCEQFWSKCLSICLICPSKPGLPSVCVSGAEMTELESREYPQTGLNQINTSGEG